MLQDASPNAPKQSALMRVVLLALQSLAPISGLMLDLLLNAINLRAVGGWRNSHRYVSVLGISNLFVHILGLSLLTGLNQAFVTFAGRAYQKHNSARLAAICGIQLKLIVVGFAALAVLVWLLTQPLFLTLGYDPDLLGTVKEYTRLMLPGQVFYLFSNYLRCYLNSVGCFTPISIASLLTLACHLSLMANFADWQLFGPPACMCLSYLLYCALLLLVAYYHGRLRQCVSVSQVLSVQPNTGSYLTEVLTQAIPGLIDIYYYQIISLLVSKIAQALSVYFIIVNLFGIGYTAALGIGATVLAKAANHIAKGHTSLLYCLFKDSLLLVLLLSLFVLTLFSVPFILQLIVGAYTQQDRLAAQLYDMIAFNKWFLLFDYLQVLLSKFLKSFGLARLVLLVMFPCYYLCGIFVAYEVGLQLTGSLKGVLAGTISGNFLLIVVYGLRLKLLDWKSVIRAKRHQIRNY